jgi:hypothetical protein
MDRNVNNELISGYSKKKKEKKDILDPADHVNVTFSLLLKRVSKKYSQSSRRCAPKSNLVDCGHILSIKLLQVKKKTLETFIFFLILSNKDNVTFMWPVGVQNVLFFTITGDKFVIYVPIRRYSRGFNQSKVVIIFKPKII